MCANFIKLIVSNAQVYVCEGESVVDEKKNKSTICVHRLVMLVLLTLLLLLFVFIFCFAEIHNTGKMTSYNSCKLFWQQMKNM